MKALIIADPWIGYILDGSKTWEMRSTAVKHRGFFGLIRKGTGAVWGVARLVETGSPLSPDEMIATFDRHRIPEDMIRSGEVAKWNTPWILADIHRLQNPVPYRHPSGAVTWVELDEDVSAAIDRQIAGIKFTHEKPLGISEPEERAVPEQNVSIEASARTPATLVVSKAAKGKLIGQVEITQGNIDNSHIYLRSFIDHFPVDAIGGSNKHQKAARSVIVEWGGGAPVETDIDGSKRFFRARSWIRSFFEQTGAEAGDKVMVEETNPYSYYVWLQKARLA